MTTPATSGSVRGAPGAAPASGGGPPGATGHGAAGAGPRAGAVSRLVRGLVLGVGCLGTLAQIARALVVVDDARLQLWFIALGGLTVLLFVPAVVRTPRRGWAVHALLALQCAVIMLLVLLARGTPVDFMTSLYVPLAAEVAVVSTGRTVWIWVGVLAALITVPLLAIQGVLEGLALAPVSLAPAVVFAAFVVVARDLEAARGRSQEMLDGLRAASARLEAYAARAGALAAVAERDRVARDLNESVATRVAGVVAAAQAAQRTLAVAPAGEPAGEGAGAGPPDEAATLLASIQRDTQQALAEMRGLIAELRPATG